MTTPDIRVEKGHAEPEEVAAIAAILMARAAAPQPAAPAHRGRPGPAGDAWNASRASEPPQLALTPKGPTFTKKVGPFHSASRPRTHGNSPRATKAPGLFSRGSA